MMKRKRKKGHRCYGKSLESPHRRTVLAAVVVRMVQMVEKHRVIGIK